MKSIRQAGTKDEAKSAETLQGTLIELQALQLQTKQAHWNVSGRLFWPLHVMLQEHYEGFAGLADTVAERLVATGTAADGSAPTIMATANLDELPAGTLEDEWILGFFARQYATVSARVMERIGELEDADPTSANLLQEVQALVDKDQWQMRAHLHPAVRSHEADDAARVVRHAATRRHEREPAGRH